MRFFYRALVVLYLFVCLSTSALAQVTNVAITGVGVGYPGGTVPVTFTVTDSGNYSSIHYDVLFSTTNTPTSAAFSSYLNGAMVCVGADQGFTFNDMGNTINTHVTTVTVPSASYSGYIMVIAVQSPPYIIQCVNVFAVSAFSIGNTPTPTYTPTFTNTPTSTFTPTLTFTKTFTNTPTNTPTFTNTFTPTYTPTFTQTFTVTSTPTGSATPTLTPTPSFLAYSITLANQKTPTFYACTPCVTTSIWTGNQAGIVPSATPASVSFNPGPSGVTITAGGIGSSTIAAHEAP